MKNITILTLLMAAFFFSCSPKNKLSKKEQKFWYLSVEKTPCFGTCPIYKIEINGLAEADKDAKRFMDELGLFKATIDKETFSELVSLTKTADWKNYKSEYLTGYSDLPSTIIRFSEHAGDTICIRYESTKAPIELQNLADKVDSLSTLSIWESVILD
ncbi:DUF6438 domain-containing protein [Bacteroidia bacterium]|nr:DUF6438 domain-containing protein [Bacteroidia bacterium]